MKTILEINKPETPPKKKSLKKKNNRSTTKHMRIFVNQIKSNQIRNHINNNKNRHK